MKKFLLCVLVMTCAQAKVSVMQKVVEFMQNDLVLDEIEVIQSSKKSFNFVGYEYEKNQPKCLGLDYFNVHFETRKKFNQKRESYTFSVGECGEEVDIKGNKKLEVFRLRERRR